MDAISYCQSIPNLKSEWTCKSSNQSPYPALAISPNSGNFFSGYISCTLSCSQLLSNKPWTGSGWPKICGPYGKSSRIMSHTANESSSKDNASKIGVENPVDGDGYVSLIWKVIFDVGKCHLFPNSSGSNLGARQSGRSKYLTVKKLWPGCKTSELKF